MNLNSFSQSTEVKNPATSKSSLNDEKEPIPLHKQEGNLTKGKGAIPRKKFVKQNSSWIPSENIAVVSKNNTIDPSEGKEESTNPKKSPLVQLLLVQLQSKENNDTLMKPKDDNNAMAPAYP